MPGPMPPQGAPAPAQAQGQVGGAQQVVAQVQDGLMKLKQLMDGAGNAVSPQDKQQLGDVITGFQALISELGKPQGQEPPQAQPQPGQMPANAGANSEPSNYSS